VSGAERARAIHVNAFDAGSEGSVGAEREARRASSEAAAVVRSEPVSPGCFSPLTIRAQSSPQQPRLETTEAASSPGQQERHSGPTEPARRARPMSDVTSRVD
jgi:hypothetical protein